MESERVQIPGSELKGSAEGRALPAADGSQTVTVTILLRRNPQASGPSEQDLLSGKYRSSGEGQAAARAAIAASPEDMAAVRSFAEQYGLRTVSADAESRRVRVEGTVEQLNKAFGVQLQQTDNHSLTYSGAISVPKPLGGVVTAVLGLDQRPIAAPRSQ